MRHSPSVVLVTAAALAGLLAGCGDGPSGAGDDLAERLDGRAFVLTALEAQEHELVAGSTVRLGFADGRLDAHAGCNSIGGGFTVTDGRLVVDQLASTEMACDPDLMTQDAWLVAFLTDDPEVTLEGAELTLAGDGSVARLEEEEKVTVPLEGTTWRLESLLDGRGPDGTASTPPRGAESATLRLDEGRLRLDTGCNTASAEVEHADSVLRAGELVISTRDCGRAMRALEDRARRVLTPPTTYVLDGSNLTLWSADGTLGLDFRAG